MLRERRLEMRVGVTVREGFSSNSFRSASPMMMGRWCATCSTVASPRWPESEAGLRHSEGDIEGTHAVKYTRQGPETAVDVQLTYGIAVLGACAGTWLEVDRVCSPQGVQLDALRLR
jgi:hypothetical protein